MGKSICSYLVCLNPMQECSDRGGMKHQVPEVMNSSQIRSFGGGPRPLILATSLPPRLPSDFEVTIFLSVKRFGYMRILWLGTSVWLC